MSDQTTPDTPNPTDSPPLDGMAELREKIDNILWSGMSMDAQPDAIVAAVQQHVAAVIGPDCEHNGSFMCNDNPVVSEVKAKQRMRAGLPEQDKPS